MGGVLHSPRSPVGRSLLVVSFVGRMAPVLLCTAVAPGRTAVKCFCFLLSFAECEEERHSVGSGRGGVTLHRRHAARIVACPSDDAARMPPHTDGICKCNDKKKKTQMVTSDEELKENEGGTPDAIDSALAFGEGPAKEIFGVELSPS